MNVNSSESEKYSLSFTLTQKIAEFLISLPNIHDGNTQRALIYSAGLDARLQNQLCIAVPPAQFVQLLVSTLSDYGMLEDGRHALEAILEAAKQYVGRVHRVYCDELITELKEIGRLAHNQHLTARDEAVIRYLKWIRSSNEHIVIRGGNEVIMFPLVTAFVSINGGVKGKTGLKVKQIT